MVVGPPGSGKSVVAQRIAGHGLGGVVSLSPSEIESALERAVRRGGHWPDAVLEAPGLVLEGPNYLCTRRVVRDLLVNLLEDRADRGLKTVICENQEDGSSAMLQRALAPGRLVTVALRFPRSRSGRMRVARRIASEMGLPKSAARGTDALEPWCYARVVEALRGVSERPEAAD